MRADSGDDTAGFAENLLALLDEGRTTATYKYGVLLALIDVCLEGFESTGVAPSSVTTRQLAERVVEIYFPQTSFFPGSGDVLRQNSGGQAEIVRAIARFRQRNAPDPSVPLSRARAASPAGWERLVRFVEWKLVEMPLPKLQRLGSDENRFLYELPWDMRGSTPRQSDVSTGRFDNRILLRPGAAEQLVRFAPLVRPLAQRKWASLVASFNHLALRGENLEDFLFGAARIPLDPVRDVLRELQDGRCFYCGGAFRADVAVDHFVPWSRHPDNGIENLVATDGRCNGEKSNFLAAARHVERWADRNARQADDLALIAARARWDRHPARTLGAARGIYLRLRPAARLWLQGRDFASAEPAALRRALGELIGTE